VTTVAVEPGARRKLPEASRLRRVRLTWMLLFFNVLGAAKLPRPLLPMPYRAEQVLTQGALVAALILVLTVNPRCRIRPNWFLGLYSLLAVQSLMMSIRFVGVGTDYRVGRLVIFLAVLWLLTPWWGRSDLLLLGGQFRFLTYILVLVVLGIPLSPHKAFVSGRLSGAIWTIPATQVAHYTAELAGLTLLLWACNVIPRKIALPLAIVSVTGLILTHTRTAALAAVIALTVAGLSLFTAKRRVRKAFAAVTIALAVLAIPLSPVLLHWATRGEDSQQLTSLTGRTNFWGAVLAEQRPETNKILGSGLSADSIDGLPIDSSWLSIYQDQGIVGEVIIATMLLLLLLTALMRPRGPTRAIALFLIVYCLIASITETGLGEASQYLLDLTLAASLIAPPVAVRALRHEKPRALELAGQP
jgi:hypothetical protein